VEGAILREGNLRLVSIDGIPAETQLGRNLLFIRNEDRPGVIGQLGTVLGQAGINIGSFVLGRSDSHSYAVGVVNSDEAIPSDVLKKIRDIPAIQFAEVVALE
jgi:D-3-phosphoglycerate dehydrogenase